MENEKKHNTQPKDQDNDYDENTIWWIYALKKFAEAANGDLSQRMSLVGPFLAFAFIFLLIGALIEHFLL